MLSRTALLTAMAVLVVGILWLACSKNSPVINGSPSATITSGIGMYFPLNEGYSTTYSVNYSNGNHETVRYEAGREIPFGSATATEWHSFTTLGDVSTSYFKINAISIDHYAGLSESPRRILELPLELGHTWAVEVNSGDDYYGYYDSLSTNNDDDKDADDIIITDNDGPLFSYPALGSIYLTVEGFEGLTLDNGTYYSSALKISSTDRSGSTSYYWYVAGVGLVKYVTDATGSDFPEGQVVGELVTYGFN
ncbi:MAG: hypothetical protein KAW46_00295 [candidate division Zixibacteria bacterium]|nr:hypothetical protein [candidate division Zixibacteria bacterium]